MNWVMSLTQNPKISYELQDKSDALDIALVWLSWPWIDMADIK